MDGNNHNHNSNNKRMASENCCKFHVRFADLDSAELLEAEVLEESGLMSFSKPSGGGGVIAVSKKSKRTPCQPICVSFKQHNNNNHGYNLQRDR